MGLFAKIVSELTAKGQDTGIVMIDAPLAGAHRTASSRALQKEGREG